jgi:crotonobetainyl-CoA:carnitine CoA-transferase CaiB-like acyl-CoA transferase
VVAAAEPAGVEDAPSRPFEGLVVVDLTQGVSGPYATMCLGDYGATVWKVEPPTGDYARALGGPFVGGASAMFNMLNRNKRSIVVDFDDPDQLAELKALIASADVLVDDLPAQRRAALGLEYTALQGENPGLVQCSINQLGTKGPWAEKVVSELELQAMTLITHFQGRPGDAPVRVGADVCTTGAGQAAFQGLVAALIARNRTGAGQSVAVSELQATLFSECIMLASYDRPDEWIGHHCSARGNEIDYGYATADEPIYFGSAYQSDQPWIDLCHALGMEELLSDPRFATLQQRTAHAAIGKPVLEQHFRRFTREHLLKVINETGNIAVPVNDHRALIEHEQVLVNDRVIRVTLQNGEELGMPGIPWEMSLTPGAATLPPPLLDEHRELLKEVSRA